MKAQKGFTIIELIVVIAIIAVLSGIIMANVSKYNKSGKDAAIKEQVSQIRIAGTDFFSTNSTYMGMCGAGTGCFNTKSNIVNLGGYIGVNSYFSDSNYCMDFKLSDNATYWCVDNTGYNGPVDNCSSLNIKCN